MHPDVLFLVGPTASGKSAVAYELAQRLGGDIVSADSMQVYRGAPLLTQQPPREWQSRVPHHLIACRDVGEPWSAAEFCRSALPLIAAIRSRNRLPLIVGGTGLYVRALLDGLCEAPAAHPEVRARVLAEVAARGADAVHQRLASIDPVAAGRIHPHDVRRIVRAIEVFEVTGEPLSQRWRAQPRDTFPHAFAMIGLDCPRPELAARINARVERMFAEGVVEEVRAISRHALSRTAQQMLGLSLITDHLVGRLTLPETVQAVQHKTSQYARRQLIWFRKETRIRWVPCDGRAPADIAAQIISHQASLAAIS